MKINLLILGIVLTLFSGCGKSPKEMMQIGQEHLLNEKYDFALESFQIVFEKYYTLNSEIPPLKSSALLNMMIKVKKLSASVCQPTSFALTRFFFLFSSYSKYLI